MFVTGSSWRCIEVSMKATHAQFDSDTSAALEGNAD